MHAAGRAKPRTDAYRRGGRVRSEADGETPVHEVSLARFWLDATTVTNEPFNGIREPATRLTRESSAGPLYSSAT